MSIAAMTWVSKLDIRPSTLKFVLIALADCANEKDEMRCWPSLAHIAAWTSQDLKTVKTSIAKLIKTGFLIPTGEMKGRTRQIKVYRLNISDEKAPKNGLVQKYEIVPKTVLLNKSENGPLKQVRFSHETSPKTDYGTLTEPLYKKPLTPAKQGNCENRKSERKISLRSRGENPRAQGTNPRTLNENRAGELPWSNRLTAFYANKFWLTDWGPKPGENGCLAPQELINSLRKTQNEPSNRSAKNHQNGEENQAKNA